MLIVDTIVAVTLVQVAAVLAAWLLGMRDAWLRRWLGVLVGVATGVLLGMVFLHLLPETVNRLGNGDAVWLTIGGTVVALFCGERIVMAVFPAGASGHTVNADSVLLASMLHSFVDGAAVATAFAAGPGAGTLTAVAIALHEVPHRMGDFSIFVHRGVPVRRALRMAVIAGIPSLAGVLAVSWLGLRYEERITWLLPVSAANFLYIAMVNLIPELARESRAGILVVQLISLLSGALLVMVIGKFFSL